MTLGVTQQNSSLLISIQSLKYIFILYLHLHMSSYNKNNILSLFYLNNSMYSYQCIQINSSIIIFTH